MKRCQVSLFLFLLLFTLNLHAEFDVNKDSEEKVYITSETADLDRSKGIGIYRINVQIDQGSTHVKGEVITTYLDENNKIKEAIIEGTEAKLAHYETQVEEGKPILYAKAKVIKYYPQKKYIILSGNASITQGSDSIQGDQLEYDVDKQRLIAKGGNEGKNRTTIVILPKSSNNSVIGIKGKSS